MILSQGHFTVGDMIAQMSIPTMELAERSAIMIALEKWNYNVTQSARALHISRATIHRKIVKYEIQLGDLREMRRQKKMPSHFNTIVKRFMKGPL